MAVLAFGSGEWLVKQCNAGGARPDGSNGNKNGPRADTHGASALSRGGECAQVSTRGKRNDGMGTA
ncbi:hypothetical protein GCM10017556_38810 [Micromonospora sagamiensis]|nr:hypothetical protein GCM10017556_38810 [Micromonospora sagamiensis]